ncbi:MAG: hypothetical protein E7019_06030 [Alphaproteobacteria bacterium]|nr:hypothetical protein [Alphaproteobacteria bacterium]
MEMEKEKKIAGIAGLTICALVVSWMSAEAALTGFGLEVLTIAVAIVMGIEAGFSASERKPGWAMWIFHILSGAMLLLIAKSYGIVFGETYGFYIDGTADWYNVEPIWWYILYAILAFRILIIQPWLFLRARKK